MGAERVTRTFWTADRSRLARMRYNSQNNALQKHARHVNTKETQ
jgi:hypothetical protein